MPYILLYDVEPLYTFSYFIYCYLYTPLFSTPSVHELCIHIKYVCVHFRQLHFADGLKPPGGEGFPPGDVPRDARGSAADEGGWTLRARR